MVRTSWVFDSKILSISRRGQTQRAKLALRAIKTDSYCAFNVDRYVTKGVFSEDLPQVSLSVSIY